MKLKLTTQGNHTILSVTENVTHAQIPVLKAGLSKIFQAGKKTVLLDLTQTLADPSVIREITELQIWAMDSGAQLVSVSALRDVGQAGSIAEGIQILSSPMGHLLGSEARLKNQLKTLEKQLTEIERTLNSVSANESALNKLKKENSELRSHVSELEKEVARRLRGRVDPFESDIGKVRMQRLTQVLDTVLGSQDFVGSK